MWSKGLGTVSKFDNGDVVYAITFKPNTQRGGVGTPFEGDTALVKIREKKSRHGFEVSYLPDGNDTGNRYRFLASAMNRDGQFTQDSFRSTSAAWSLSSEASLNMFTV